MSDFADFELTASQTGTKVRVELDDGWIWLELSNHRMQRGGRMDPLTTDEARRVADALRSAADAEAEK